MKLLLDTHLLLWSALTPEKLSAVARELIEDPTNELLFSAVSIWEVSIKFGLGRSDFTVDPQLLRQGLLDNGFRELPLTSNHAAQAHLLPPRHRDPFDRMLITQARIESLLLLTHDADVAGYAGPIRKV